MGILNSKKILISPLKKINDRKGDIFHVMKHFDPGYKSFGEAYFTTINKGHIKGWNRHKKMFLNLVVPIGEVLFVLYDDRDKIFSEVKLSIENYKRLTVPPGYWLAFQGKKQNNYILNIASIPHNKKEIEKVNLGQFNYNWD